MTSLKPVSDPSILQQLGAVDQEPRQSRVAQRPTAKLRPVADPAVLEQLNQRQPTSMQSRTDETGQKHTSFVTNEDIDAGLQKLRDAQLFKDGMMGDVSNAAIDYMGSGIKATNSVANAAIKGTRDLTAGVASYPFDLANELGLTNEIGPSIRKALPQLDTNNVGEDLGSALVQYGVPTGAAIKGTTALAGAASPIAANVARWLGAAYSDLIATDPDQASTIGSAVGLGPSEIQPDDSAMDKRTKVGGEALVLGPAVDAVAAAGRKLTSLAEPVVQRFKQSGREKMVGKEMTEAGVTPQTATDAAALRQDGYKPLTSDVVNTPQSQNLARGAVNSPAGASVVQRMKENEQAIAQSMDKSLAGDGTAQNAAQTAFKGEQQAAEIAGDTAETALTGRRATAQTALQGEQGAIAQRAGTRQDASASLAEMLDAEKASATRVKGGLYDQAVELGRQVQIDPAPLTGVARQIETDIGRLAQQNPDLANILDDIQRLAPQEGQAVVPTTLADLIDLKPRLSRAIDAATGKVRGDVVQRLTTLRTAIDGQINALSQGGDPAAQALRAAETNFRENFAPKFREGVGGKLDKGERARAPTAPTAVAGEFLRTNTSKGAREAVGDLNRIFEGTPNQQAAVAAGRNYMTGLMADSLPAGGAAEAVHVERFLQKYGEALDGLGMRAEVQQMANRLRSGEQTIGTLDQEIKAAQQAAGEVSSSFQRSPAGLWIDDPQKAVQAALKDPRQMDELVRAANADPTGEALKDIQNQVGDAVNRQIRNEGSQTLGGNTPEAVKPADLNVSLAKANEMLGAGTPTRAALEKLYGPGKMKALDLYRKQLELSARMTGMRGSKGSDSTVNMLSALRSGINVSQGGIGGGYVVRFVEFLDQHSFKTGAKIADLQARALTDPDLAVTLMMQYNDSTAAVVERRLRLYLENNLLVSDQKDSQ